MSKVRSLKLQEEIFNDAEEVVKKLKIPRNTFMNQAIAYYTRIQKRKLLAKQLKKESIGVRGNSMRVLKEFEAFEFDDLDRKL